MRSDQDDMDIENAAGAVKGDIDTATGVRTSSLHIDIHGGEAGPETDGVITEIQHTNEYVDPGPDLPTVDKGQGHTIDPLDEISAKRNEVTPIDIEVSHRIEQNSNKVKYLFRALFRYQRSF